MQIKDKKHLPLLSLYEVCLVSGRRVGYCMACRPLRLSKAAQLQVTVNFSCVTIAFVLKKTWWLSKVKPGHLSIMYPALLYLPRWLLPQRCISFQYINLPPLLSSPCPPSASLSHSLFDQIIPKTLYYLDPRRVPPFCLIWLEARVMPVEVEVYGTMQPVVPYSLCV